MSAATDLRAIVAVALDCAQDEHDAAAGEDRTHLLGIVDELHSLLEQLELLERYVAVTLPSGQEVRKLLPPRPTLGELRAEAGYDPDAVTDDALRGYVALLERHHDGPAIARIRLRAQRQGAFHVEPQRAED